MLENVFTYVCNAVEDEYEELTQRAPVADLCVGMIGESLPFRGLCYKGSKTIPHHPSAGVRCVQWVHTRTTIDFVSQLH